MISALLSFVLRDIRQSLRNPAVLAGLAGAVVVLGVSDPFNTLTRFDLATRLAYWAAIALATVTVGQVGSMMLARAASPLPRPLRLVLRSLGSGLAALAVLQLFTFVPQDAGVDAATLVSVLVICLVIEILGDLVALCLRDHYVDVITTKGKGRTLMRLSDAIRECAPAPRLQIHRSTWGAQTQAAEVSLHCAQGPTRTRERLTVMRQRLKYLTEAGLFPPKEA